jgi:hypothetical protein
MESRYVKRKSFTVPSWRIANRETRFGRLAVLRAWRPLQRLIAGARPPVALRGKSGTVHPVILVAIHRETPGNEVQAGDGVAVSRGTSSLGKQPLVPVQG